MKKFYIFILFPVYNWAMNSDIYVRYKMESLIHMYKHVLITHHEDLKGWSQNFIDHPENYDLCTEFEHRTGLSREIYKAINVIDTWKVIEKFNLTQRKHALFDLNKKSAIYQAKEQKYYKKFTKKLKKLSKKDHKAIHIKTIQSFFTLFSTSLDDLLKNSR